MAEPKAEVLRFVARVQIAHDRLYEPGDEIELRADAAPAHLIESGAIEPAAKKPPAKRSAAADKG